MAGNVTRPGAPWQKLPTAFCRGPGVRAQFGLVHLQLKGVWGLGEGQKFGFGEGAATARAPGGASHSAGHRFAGDEDQRKVVRRPCPEHRFAQYLGLRQSGQSAGTISCCSDALPRCRAPRRYTCSKASPAKGATRVVDVKVGSLACVCRQARVQRCCRRWRIPRLLRPRTRNHPGTVWRDSCCHSGGKAVHPAVPTFMTEH